MDSRATDRWLAILRRPRATAILVVLALLAAGAAVLTHRHCSGRQPLSLQTVAIAPSTIRQEAGRCWVVDLGTTWMASHRRPSGARLLEDGRDLGPANAERASVCTEGGGRFSFGNGQLYFSSSDGTEPPTNGKRYEILWPTPVPYWLKFGIEAFAVLSGLLAAFAAAQSWASGGQAWLHRHVVTRVGRVTDRFSGPQGHWRVCFVVGLVAMFARVVAVAIVHADPAGHISSTLIMGVPFSDAKDWDNLGESLMMGDGLAGAWSARRAFLAFVIGSLYAWTGPMPDAVVALNVLLGAWTAALVCRIGQRVFGPAVGLVAGLAFAFDPISLEYCSYLLTETLGTFLFVFSVRQILAGLQQNRAPSCWWAGVLFALSNLTRTLTLPAAPLFALAALLEGRKNGGDWRRGIVLAVAFCLGVGLPLGAWIVRQQVVHGLTTISDNTASGLYGAASPKYGVWNGMIDREADDAGIPGDIKPRYEWCMRRFHEELNANPWFYVRNALGSGWGGLMTLAGVAKTVRCLLVLLLAVVWLSRLPTPPASARLPVPWLLVFAALAAAIIALPRHGLLLLAGFGMIAATVRRERLAWLLLAALGCTIAAGAAFALCADPRLLLMVSWMMPMALAHGVLVILVTVARHLGDRGAAEWLQATSGATYTPRWQTFVVRSIAAFFVVSMSLLAFRNFVSPLPHSAPLGRPTVEEARMVVQRVAEASPGSVVAAELADPETWYKQVDGPDPTPGHGRLVVATLRLPRQRYPVRADTKANQYSRMFVPRSYDRLCCEASCQLTAGGFGGEIVLPPPWPVSDCDILVVGRANVDRAYVYEENYLEVLAWAPFGPDGKADLHRLQVTTVPEHIAFVRSLQR